MIAPLLDNRALKTYNKNADRAVNTCEAYSQKGFFEKNSFFLLLMKERRKTMLIETYKISRESTKQLLHGTYHPNADEIKHNNKILEKMCQTMHVTKDDDGATVEFDDLDFQE